jgi:hypothetical protein
MIRPEFCHFCFMRVTLASDSSHFPGFTLQKCGSLHESPQLGTSGSRQ